MIQNLAINFKELQRTKNHAKSVIIDKTCDLLKNQNKPQTYYLPRGIMTQ